ncbi:MAG: aminotransferase class V-fold PLP-dependent enzyme [Rhodobacter sp.]|nr:aminotransferase class V-fold PLP-dependent enzyme [Rhodobacter sp.]
MSLANGRHYLAIPGPSVMPDRVLAAMHRAAPNIYEGALVDMMPALIDDLKAVAKTDGNVAIYIANGHGAWEAALANTHDRGDRVLVLATGRFAHGWAEQAERLGLKCDIVDFGRSSDIDMARVAEALATDKAHSYKSVLVTHVDTSTSIRNDVAGVREVLNAARHPALLMVDCIASLACDRFQMDAWGVDVMVAASQKGLMTPPGVSFVYFNAKGDAARDAIQHVSGYWDWRPRTRPQDFYQYFAGTAPTHHLYGLREALDMIAEEGLEAIFARHEKLARAVWAAVDAWSREGPMQLNVADPAKRSCAVTSVRLKGNLGGDLRGWVTQKAGVTLGIGLGMSEEGRSSDEHFRIAHMGHVNSHMVLGTLGAIEAGLTALDIPHGTGALDAAAKVCATA